MRHLLLIIILFYSGSITAQSLYVKDSKESFSFNGGISGSEDSFSYNIGANFTSKNTNFGVFFSKLEAHPPNDESTIVDKGVGFGLFLSKAVLNELKGDPLGIEVGFSLNHSIFENINFTNTSLGAGLNISKRNIRSPKALLVPQLGVSLFPVSLSRIDAFGSQISENSQFFVVTTSAGFVFFTPNDREIVVEPSLNYNVTDRFISYGATVVIIL